MGWKEGKKERRAARWIGAAVRPGGCVRPCGRWVDPRGPLHTCVRMAVRVIDCGCRSSPGATCQGVRGGERERAEGGRGVGERGRGDGGGTWKRTERKTGERLGEGLRRRRDLETG